MEYLLMLVICAAVGFSIGFGGSWLRRRIHRIPPFLLVAVGALAGLAVACAFNYAQAVPADVEAYSQPSPVDYRPCRHAAPFELAMADERRPLPPTCILPLPLQPATVAKPSTDYRTRPPMFKGMQQ